MDFQTFKASPRIPGGPPSQYQEGSSYEDGSSTLSSSGTLSRIGQYHMFINSTSRRSTIVSPNDQITLPAIYGGGTQSSSRSRFGMTFTRETTTESRKEAAPGSCVVCMENFSPALLPPSSISASCNHTPNTCTNCLQQSIKSDLASKLWSQIQCPECSIILIYDDVRRLADAETFARYETMSFRSAVSTDDNFIWCQKCNFGQLHASGKTHPIVRCLNCSFRSCFRHSVPWHDRLTCDEYDAMMRDPDNFRSAVDRDEEHSGGLRQQQMEDDEALARSLMEEERHVEEDRQRQRHQESLRQARAEQEAQAQRMRDREEAEKRQALKRRQRDERKSLATIKQKTKLCPGCKWPIEKNAGCAHMTCTKCRFEFCWECLTDYRQIIQEDNSRHQESCKFHTDNLA